METEAETDAEATARGVRDYIESMLDQLAELAGRSGEPKIATVIRVAALEVSRLEAKR